MQEVFDKIIEKLEESEERYEDVAFMEMSNNGHTLDFEYAHGKKDSMNEAIEIVKQEAEQYEECYKDCRECEAYNKEKHHCPKFCHVITEAVKEIEENHNGWIPCRERLPECENGFETTALMFQLKTGTIEVGYFGVGGKVREKYFRHYRNSTDGVDASDVVAWQPLPQPYQPKGE